MHIFSSVLFTLAPGTMQSVAVTRMDDFIRGGNLPSLTDRFLWRVSQSQPAAAHHYRYASDICSSRSSSTKSKTLPVGFHKEPDSWIICGGFSVAMSCMTPSFLLEGLDQPASVFLSTLPNSAASSREARTGERNWNLGATGRKRHMNSRKKTQESFEFLLSEISKKILLTKP